MSNGLPVLEDIQIITTGAFDPGTSTGNESNRSSGDIGIERVDRQQTLAIAILGETTMAQSALWWRITVVEKAFAGKQDLIGIFRLPSTDDVTTGTQTSIPMTGGFRSRDTIPIGT